MDGKRVYYWDNFKCILIFLVAAGHFLIPVARQGRSIETVYYFIYLFHMPAFVFVSGFFAQRYMKKDVPVVGKLTGFLILYVLYKVCIWGVQGLCTGKFPNFNLLTETGAPWYLFALFAWHLILPLLARFKAPVCIAFTVLLGLYIGTVDNIGPFFCLSRIIVFLPFFMAGFYFRQETAFKLTNPKLRAVSLALLSGTAAAVLLNLKRIHAIEALLYGNTPYRVISGLSAGEAAFARLCLYGVAFLMIAAVLSLTPKRKLPVSYIGARTLSVYFVHRLLRDVCSAFGLYEKTGLTGAALLIVVLAFSALVTWISSAKIFDRLLNSVFHINYGPLLRTGKAVEEKNGG